jgi:V-type H+-transporting ATPase subunit C
MEKFTMLLVSVPSSECQKTSFESVGYSLGSAATLANFIIPGLRVGTLDSLMILDEELAKVDVMAEQSISKIQRQYEELTDSDAAAGGEAELLVKGTKPFDYLSGFAWDDARYPHNRRLNELVQMIQQNVGKIDDDIKTLSQDYNDTKQTLSSLQRKRGANLMVADLKDVLTQNVCVEKTGSTPQELFNETTFLKPVAVIVPVASEEQFLNTYERICDSVVTLKSDNSKFSPVVPGSKLEILRDTDGYILYRVLVLKGSMEVTVSNEAADADNGDGATQNDTGGAAANQTTKRCDFFTLFAEACRSHRFVVKEFDLTPYDDEDNDGEEQEETLDAQIAQVKTERDRQILYLKRRCTPYFEDVYVAWIHIKAIRVFVESVLRYGVPPQFQAALIVPAAPKNMRRVRQILEKAYHDLDTMNASKLAVSEDVQRLLGSGTSSEYLPYVNISINFLDR